MMPAPTQTRRRNATADAESMVMLYEGANLSQLGVLFRMDHRVLVEKLHGCPATGSRNGTDIWRIDVAAPYLVKPIFDIETYIKKMNHADLPKMVTKEYWAGQKTRMEVERMQGDSWDTTRVVKAMGGVMKLVKNNVRLFIDAVNRQSELSDAQVKILKNLGDGLLNQMYHEVLSKFEEEPSNDAVVAMAEVEVAAVQEDDDEL